MVSSGGNMKCKKCGYLTSLESDEKMIKTTLRKEKEITIVDSDEIIATLPTTHIKCPECGHGTAEWWLRQLRSADESEVRFFRCMKCRNTWREYD